MLLVLGSINADLLFKVETLPRPGETVLCPGYVMAPGGKGANQAAAAAKAGAEVRFVGHVGDDPYGPVVRGFMEDAGVDCRGLAVATKPTAIAVIGVDAAGENAIIVGSGANLDTDALQVPDTALGPAVTVLCQNEIRAEATGGILKRAKALGARTILNLAPAGTMPGDVLDALDVLVLNELEAAMLAGREAPAASLAGELATAHELTCVVTLGAEGAIAVGPDAGWRIGALPVQPVDTTGAGDTFVGVLAAALDQGQPLPEALRTAAVAAGLACEAMGAQTGQPSRAMIEARLAEMAPAIPLDR